MKQTAPAPFGSGDVETTSDPTAEVLQQIHGCISLVIMWVGLPCRDGFELSPQSRQPRSTLRNKCLPKAQLTQFLLQANPLAPVAMRDGIDVDAKVRQVLIQCLQKNVATACSFDNSVALNVVIPDQADLAVSVIHAMRGLP